MEHLQMHPGTDPVPMVAEQHGQWIYGEDPTLRQILAPSPLKVFYNFESCNPVIPWTKLREKQGSPHPLHYYLLC